MISMENKKQTKKEQMKPGILVVDDSETNLVLLRAVLEDEGYEVFTVFNSKEALKFLEANKPGLILLDLLMPEVGGIDLLKIIKKNNTYASIPVIVVTAYANKENRYTAKELGAVDIIEKPIDLPDFIAKINRAYLTYSIQNTQ